MESPHRESIRKLQANIESVFFGNRRAVRLTLTTLLARGHLLIEDAPGVGKTLLARAVARSLELDFKRIQFTPDLLPSDVTGVSIYDPARREFEFKAGPVFTNVLLADEINRGTPRTQSSLLETMGETQVSVDGVTMELARPFFVLATQNPIELQGTYLLPEAQLDRFLMRIELGYPSSEDETRILATHRNEEPIDSLEPVMTGDDLIACQAEVAGIHVADSIREYIVAIAGATREHDGLRLGLSPRGSIALMKAAQGWTYLDGREFVTPDDVKAVAPSVMGHRLMIDSRYEFTGGKGDELAVELLERIPIPTTPAERAG